MSTPQTQYKPSPLSISKSSGSPRASPFRRQNSNAGTPSSQPSSPGGPPTLRPTTPTNGASHSTRPSTPSKLQTASIPSQDATTFSPRQRPESPTKSSSSAPYERSSPHGGRSNGNGFSHGPPHSTFHGGSTPTSTSTSTSTSASAGANLDALARLPAPLVRALRDAFSLLDRESTGTLTPADVSAMHAQLGLPAPSAAELAAYFPPGVPTPLALPAFLGGLAGPLARMDSADELLEALGAFDERESGAVPLADLLDAVCGAEDDHHAYAAGYGRATMSRADVQDHVMKGFIGRPRLSKGLSGGLSANSATGDVFRYREWVANLGAGGEAKEAQAVEG